MHLLVFLLSCKGFDKVDKSYSHARPNEHCKDKKFRCILKVKPLFTSKVIKVPVLVYDPGV